MAIDRKTIDTISVRFKIRGVWLRRSKARLGPLQPDRPFSPYPPTSVYRSAPHGSWGRGRVLLGTSGCGGSLVEWGIREIIPTTLPLNRHPFSRSAKRPSFAGSKRDRPVAYIGTVFRHFMVDCRWMVTHGNEVRAEPASIRMLARRSGHNAPSTTNPSPLAPLLGERARVRGCSSASLRICARLGCSIDSLRPCRRSAAVGTTHRARLLNL